MISSVSVDSNGSNVHVGIDSGEAVVGADEQAAVGGSADHSQVSQVRAAGDGGSIRNGERGNGSRRDEAAHSDRTDNDSARPRKKAMAVVRRGSGGILLQNHRESGSIRRISLRRTSDVGPRASERPIHRRAPPRGTSASTSGEGAAVVSEDNADSATTRSSSESAIGGDRDASGTSRASWSSSRSNRDARHDLFVGVVDVDGSGSTSSRMGELDRCGVGRGREREKADGGETGDEADDTLAKTMTHDFLFQA
jgi:hypothetical protein